MGSEVLLVMLAALACGAAIGAVVAARRAPPTTAPDDADARVLDQRLAAMQGELARVTGLVRSLEHDRAEQLGLLSGQLRAAGEQTRHLAESTRQLREALASSQTRGQWGERMAEDVLRLAGFVEGVSYRRQTAIPGRGTMPDFTFLLPRDRVVHMDVKFPLDNYLRSVNAADAAAAERHRRAFLRDVRDRIRELSGRGYVDPDETVDCVLLFIPNEALAAYVQQHDPGLLDEALRAKVVCCSPLTLFAVLAVIRQAVDAFSLEQRTGEVLDELGAFGREWDRFVAQMDRVETHLDRARRAYDDLVGVRRRTLERPLERLAEVRRGPAPAAGGRPDTVPDALPDVGRLAPTGTDAADSGGVPRQRSGDGIPGRRPP